MKATVRIYQLDMVRAKNLIFIDRTLDIFQRVEPQQYNLVHEDIIEMNSVGDICVIFGESQMDPRRGLFRGWPLQINDLIEVIHDDAYTLYQYERWTWDSDGSLMLLDRTDASTAEHGGRKYDLSAAEDRRNHLFGVLVNPNEPAEYADIELCDTVITSLFGNRYKAVSLVTGECLLCSENAFHHDKRTPGLNRMLIDGLNNAYGVVANPMFFCGMNQAGTLFALAPNECRKLFNRYYLPEDFYTFRGELKSVKFYPTPSFNKGVGK